MKRTYQPNTLWRKRTHGFRERMKTIGGRLRFKKKTCKRQKTLICIIVIAVRQEKKLGAAAKFFYS